MMVKIPKKPSKSKNGLLAATDEYEAEGQSPLEAALARRRKKIALDKTGFLSDEDKAAMGQGV